MGRLTFIRSPSALAELVPDAERIDVSGDEFAYGRLLAELWRDGDSFLIIEHDIEATIRALEEARCCGCPWGANPYRHGRSGLLREALGFTRFSSDLLRDFPDAVERSDEIKVQERGPDWLYLDGRLHATLVAAGYAVHMHRAEVGHHHWLGDIDGEHCSCGARTQRLCLTKRHHFNAPECACDGIDRRWHDGSSALQRPTSDWYWARTSK